MKTSYEKEKMLKIDFQKRTHLCVFLKRFSLKSYFQQNGFEI